MELELRLTDINEYVEIERYQPTKSKKTCMTHWVWCGCMQQFDWKNRYQFQIQALILFLKIID